MKPLVIALIVAAGVALLVLSGCGSSVASERRADAKSKTQPAYPVRVAPVAAQDVQYDIHAVGSVEAQDIYRIEARVAGTVEDVHFNEGDSVKTDQVLCRISAGSYELTAQRAEALYRQAVAGLASFKQKSANAIARAKVALAEAQNQITRRKNVQRTGAISDEEIQTFEVKRDLATILLKDAEEEAVTEARSLEAAIAEKEAAWKLAVEDVADSIVQPPVEGVVEQRLAVPGTHVVPGTPLATIVDRRSLKLVFKVAEKDSAALRKGTRVSFSVPAWPDRSFAAEIYHIGGQLEPDSRAVNCWARVTNELDKLKPGYYAAVNIATGGQESVVAPSTAVLPTETGYVAFVVKAGRAERRSVSVGLSLTGDQQEILSGLRAGELLVVEGANALQDGVPVRVLSESALKTQDSALRTSVQ